MPIEGVAGLPGEAVGAPRWPADPLPARIAIDGLEVRLRPGDTGALLAACAAGNWSAFVPGLLARRDRLALSARLDDAADPLDLLELSAAAQWSAAYVCRMHWWSACRLAAAAREHWHSIDGAGVLCGADLLALPLHRVLYAVWAYLLERRRGQEDDAVQSLVSAVFESGPEALALANVVAPRSLDALEARWAQEAAASFAGMDGVWSPFAPAG